MFHRKDKLNVSLANDILAKNNYDRFEPELSFFQYDCEKEELIKKNLNHAISLKYFSMRPPRNLKSYRFKFLFDQIFELIKKTLKIYLALKMGSSF